VTPGTVKTLENGCACSTRELTMPTRALHLHCAQARLPIGKSSHFPTSIHGLSGSLIAKVRELHIGFCCDIQSESAPDSMSLERFAEQPSPEVCSTSRVSS
jgi:hypothetical protein